MDKKTDKIIQNSIKEKYGNIARERTSGCGCTASLCCDNGDKTTYLTPKEYSSMLGYSLEEITIVPEDSNLGLGCGNPQTIANLRVGETVLDLGSGAGFDSFLAARQIGSQGRVIGIDMTLDMVHKAQENAKKGHYRNIDFQLGEIEHLPIVDESIDVIISNCVINLSTDKTLVFQEAFRVLKPGGRLAISDVVTTAELPENIKNDLALYSACISGALEISSVEDLLKNAGFIKINILPLDQSRNIIKVWSPEHNPEEYIQSVSIQAQKPVI